LLEGFEHEPYFAWIKFEEKGKTKMKNEKEQNETNQIMACRASPLGRYMGDIPLFEATSVKWD
jgi:hypothetical protein